MSSVGKKRFNLQGDLVLKSNLLNSTTPGEKTEVTATTFIYLFCSVSIDV